MPTQLFLVRHGETDMSYLQKHPLQNRDVSLNQNGVNQIEKVSLYLQDKHLKKVVSDNTLRTLQTSRIIGDLQIPPISKIEIEPRLTNKESTSNIKKNIINLLKIIEDEDTNSNICWICHGKIIKIIYYLIEYSQFPKEISKLSWCYYGSIHCLEFNNGTWNTKYWGKKIED